MFIEEVYSYVSKLCQKETIANFTVEFFNESARQCQWQLIEERVGNIYDYGKEGKQERIFLQKTQVIEQDLRTLISTANITCSSSSRTGTANIALPADFYHLIEINYDYSVDVARLKETTSCTDPAEYVSITLSKTVPFDLMRENQFTLRQFDNVAPPTLEYPIATFYPSGELLAAPNSLVSKTVNLVYLKTPADPMIDENNPANNVDFTLNASLMNELVVRICQYVGLSEREIQLQALPVGTLNINPRG
jgi:hypothetical protein